MHAAQCVLSNIAHVHFTLSAACPSRCLLCPGHAASGLVSSLPNARGFRARGS